MCARRHLPSETGHSLVRTLGIGLSFISAVLGLQACTLQCLAVFLWILGVERVPSPLTELSPQSLSLSHALAADSLSSLWAFTLSSCHQPLKFQGQILHMRNFKWSNSPLCPCWSQLMLTGTSEAVDHHENDCHLEETQCSSSGSRSPRWSPAQF